MSKKMVVKRQKAEAKERENKLHELEKQRFLSYVRKSAKYWAELPGKTALEVAVGTAFSILVALDGEACGCGPYVVKPIRPSNREGQDIAGSLHEELHKVDKKGFNMLPRKGD